MQTHTIPKNAVIVDPVDFEIVRQPGQPNPLDFAVPSNHTYNVGKRTRPVEFPQPHMYIPKTRGLAGVDLWEERCKVIPKHQNWCLVWVFFTPLEAGKTFKSLKMVFVGTYKTKQMAESAQMRARGMYPGRASMISQVGFWQALPIPRWLHNESDIDAYNGTIIKRLIDQELKKVRIEHELLKRRSQARADIEADAPEVATEKIENAVYGVLPTHKDRSDEKHDVRRVDKWTSVDGDGLVAKKERIGLIWVLPSVQCKGRHLNDIAFAWLGTFKSSTDANNQQLLIKEKHPEWDVHSFTVGKPIDVPVPVWDLQKKSKVQYNQKILGDFMRSNPTSTETPTDILPPIIRGSSQTTKDDELQLNEKALLDSIDPRLASASAPPHPTSHLTKLSEEIKDLGHGLTIKTETFKPMGETAATSESDLQLVVDSPQFDSETCSDDVFE